MSDIVRSHLASRCATSSPPEYLSACPDIGQHPPAAGLRQRAAPFPGVVVLAVTSVAGLFYYLRIVVTVYSPPPERLSLVPTLAQGFVFILGTLTILLIWLGLYPAPLRDLIRATIGGLN